LTEKLHALAKMLGKRVKCKNDSRTSEFALELSKLHRRTVRTETNAVELICHQTSSAYVRIVSTKKLYTKCYNIL